MNEWWKQHGYRTKQDFERDMEEVEANVAQGCCFFGLIAAAWFLTFLMIQHIGSTT